MLCIACGQPSAAPPCVCGADPRLDGRYALIEPLAHGATATLWLAEGPEGPGLDPAKVGRPVAIKEIRLPTGVARLKARELAEREADVLRQLDHPGVPRFHELLFTRRGRGEVAWLVEERIVGHTLADEIDAGPMEPEDALRLAEGVLAVLAHLHSLSPPIVHRDVKPGNVMRRADGGLVLVDFGSVRDVREEGGSTVAGTFGYIAPEQLVGDATPAADVYSVGMLILALITAREPKAFLDRRGDVVLGDDTWLPDEVTSLLQNLLDPDPEGRPRDGAAALVRVRGARRAMAAGPEPPPVRREIGWAGTAVVVLVAFVALFVEIAAYAAWVHR